MLDVGDMVTILGSLYETVSVICLDALVTLTHWLTHLTNIRGLNLLIGLILSNIKSNNNQAFGGVNIDPSVRSCFEKAGDRLEMFSSQCKC